MLQRKKKKKELKRRVFLERESFLRIKVDRFQSLC